LGDTEERFRLMVDRAPVIIWSARPDRALDYVNGTCGEFTGRPVEKLLDGSRPRNARRRLLRQPRFAAMNVRPTWQWSE
jgi:PAS domain-containing protein